MHILLKISIGVFIIYTIRDIVRYNKSNTDQQDDDNFQFNKKIPETTLNQIPTTDTIIIKYCYACNYRRAFEEFSYALISKYPLFIIEGENYQPTGFRMQLYQIISVGKLILICMFLSNIWPSFFDHIISPGIKAWITNHKLYASLMTFFIANVIESRLLATGAFEIEYNGITIWSKLKTNAIPSPDLLFDIIDKINAKSYRLDN